MSESESSKPHYTGHRKRLRQRYMKSGIEALNEYEALELLLTYIHSRKDVKPEAKTLLKRFGTIKGVLDAGYEKLIQVDGIGEGTALLVNLVKDLTTMYLKETFVRGKVVCSPVDIIEYPKASLGSLQDERFIALYLNSRNEVLADEIVSEGTVNQAAVYPRKVLEKAIKHKATAIILVHNHPGGTLGASSNDLAITKHIKQAADTLGITIHDHLIVTRSSYFSFSEKGLL